MATAINIITRMMREIGVKAQNEEPTAYQTQQGLQDLKAMIASFELDGIDMGDGSDITSATYELPYPENHTDAIMYNLAVRSASKYGRVAKDTTVAFAQKGYRGLQAVYGSVIDMSVDNALRARTRFPSGRNF